MDSVCYAKKKNGELCNTNLKDKNKHEIKIENKIYSVCGRHKKINNIENIDVSKYEISDKSKKDNIISNDKNNEESKKKENNKPCLQYIKYLISKDDNDMCQFKDCQFAHNVNIIYTDK